MDTEPPSQADHSVGNNKLSGYVRPRLSRILSGIDAQYIVDNSSTLIDMIRSEMKKPSRILLAFFVGEEHYLRILLCQ